MAAESAKQSPNVLLAIRPQQPASSEKSEKKEDQN
jgi:hypothetical protein